MPLPKVLTSISQRIVTKGQTILTGKIIPQTAGPLENPEQLTGRQLYLVTLDELCESTRFTRKEVCSLYRGLKEECPAGFVDEFTFVDIMAHFFPLGDSTRYIQHVFRAFNPDEFGHIGFRHLLQTLSTVLRGDADDKIRWMFNLYDVNQDGVITEDELQEVVDAIFELLQPEVYEHDDSPDDHARAAFQHDDSPREHTRSAFQKLDLYRNGLVTFECFSKACKENPDIMNSLDAFNTIIMIR